MLPSLLPSQPLLLPIGACQQSNLRDREALPELERREVCLSGLKNKIHLQKKKAMQKLHAEMREADTNHDGMISFSEFLLYFQRMARFQAEQARQQRLAGFGRDAVIPKSEWPRVEQGAAAEAAACGGSDGPLGLPGLTWLVLPQGWCGICVWRLHHRVMRQGACRAAAAARVQGRGECRRHYAAGLLLAHRIFAPMPWRESLPTLGQQR